MAVFAVHLAGESATDCVERLHKHYPKPEHYQLADEALYLVRSNAISQTIAEDIGLKGDDRVEGVTGIVFKLNSAYSGYASRSAWEWLDREDDDG